MCPKNVWTSPTKASYVVQELFFPALCSFLLGEQLDIPEKMQILNFEVYTLKVPVYRAVIVLPHKNEEGPLWENAMYVLRIMLNPQQHY